MRFPLPCRMTDLGDAGPAWARKKRRSGSPPVIGLIVTLLALFGALTGVLGVKEQSLAKGGAMIDGWISAGWNGALTLVGQQPGTGEE